MHIVGIKQCKVQTICIAFITVQMITQVICLFPLFFIQLYFRIVVNELLQKEVFYRIPWGLFICLFVQR